MKIKHWAGYGCVNVKKVVSIDGALTLEITGDHERGLVPPEHIETEWYCKIAKRYHITPDCFVTDFCYEDGTDRLILCIYKKEV